MLIFALKNIHRANADVMSAEQKMIGLIPPESQGRRERDLSDARSRLQKTRDDLDCAHSAMVAHAVEVRTTSFQAAVHAPSLELKKAIREIISRSNLDAMTQAMLYQSDYQELERIAERARPEALVVIERVHALIDAQR